MISITITINVRNINNVRVGKLQDYSVNLNSTKIVYVLVHDVRLISMTVTYLVNLRSNKKINVIVIVLLCCHEGVTVNVYYQYELYDAKNNLDFWLSNNSWYLKIIWIVTIVRQDTKTICTL